MVNADVLKDWANSLADDDEVSIEAGGLILQAASGAYLEVGGEPLEDQAEEG